MKTSDLVRYRNSLQENVDSIKLDQPITKVCELLNTLATQHPDVSTAKLTQFSTKYQDLLAQSLIYVANLEDYINDLTTEIDSLAKNDFSKSNNPLWDRTFYEGLNDDYFVTEDIKERVKTSISRYIDWHYPTLHFGCRLNGKLPRLPGSEFKTLGSRLNTPDMFLEFEDGLTGGEPFYVCDFSDELINQFTSKFNPIFRGKICNYTIDGADFSQLPQEQFSFILAWNMFNYTDIETLETYLINLNNLLKPGGVILFSYNNCDIPASVMMAELFRESYIPKRHLINLCNNLGFDILDTNDMLNEADMFPYTYVSWAEIKKPGTLTTTKAHASLGKIQSN